MCAAQLLRLRLSRHPPGRRGAEACRRFPRPTACGLRVTSVWSTMARPSENPDLRGRPGHGRAGARVPARSRRTRGHKHVPRAEEMSTPRGQRRGRGLSADAAACLRGDGPACSASRRASVQRLFRRRERPLDLRTEARRPRRRKRISSALQEASVEPGGPVPGLMPRGSRRSTMQGLAYREDLAFVSADARFKRRDSRSASRKERQESTSSSGASQRPG